MSSQDPDYRPRKARVRRIHDLLQAGKHVNAVSLMPILGVSEKTVRNDLYYMRDTMGLPMDYSFAKKGFYYTCEVVALPDDIVSEKQIHLLALLEHFLGHFKGSDIEKQIKRLIREIASQFPDGYAKERSNWSEILSVHYTHQSRVEPKTLDFLFHAAMDQRVVTLLYGKAGERKYRPRTLDPLHIRIVDGDLYLFARDHANNRRLRYSMARMRGVAMTDATFERPKDFDINKEVEKSFSIHHPEGNFHIVIRLTAYAADVVRERAFTGQTALVDLSDGRAELHLNLSSLVEIRRWIGEWLPHVVIMSPPELIQMVDEDIQTYQCARKREGL